MRSMHFAYVRDVLLGSYVNALILQHGKPMSGPCFWRKIMMTAFFMNKGELGEYFCVMHITNKYC